MIVMRRMAGTGKHHDSDEKDGRYRQTLLR